MTKTTFTFSNEDLQDLVTDYLEEVIEYNGLESVQQFDLQDVHQEVFNSYRNEYIYYSEAETDLQGYGVFNALEDVTEGHECLLGEDYVYTNSCDLANNLLYFKGSDYLAQFDDMEDLLEKLGFIE